MDGAQITVIFILIIPLTLAAFNRLGLDVAALCITLFFGIFQFCGMGLLGPAGASGEAVKAISGFSQPVVITLISLFILTRSLEKSGATNWVTHRLLDWGGHNLSLLIGLFCRYNGDSLTFHE